MSLRIRLFLGPKQAPGGWTWGTSKLKLSPVHQAQRPAILRPVETDMEEVPRPETLKRSEANHNSRHLKISKLSISPHLQRNAGSRAPSGLRGIDRAAQGELGSLQFLYSPRFRVQDLLECTARDEVWASSWDLPKPVLKVLTIMPYVENYREPTTKMVILVVECTWTSKVLKTMAHISLILGIKAVVVRHSGSPGSSLPLSLADSETPSLRSNLARERSPLQFARFYGRTMSRCQ